MEQQSFELFRQCTVRVAVQGKIGHGSGFFVAPGLILSCAHVVKAAKSAASSVEIFWNGQDHPAQIIEFLPGPDLVLLQVSLTEHPCVLLQDEAMPFDMLYSYGYPDDHPDGDPATFTFEGKAGERGEQLKFKTGQVRSGMSGAPILNLRTGRVCGVVQLTRGRDSDLGGRAIPTREVLLAFPDVERLQWEFHQQNPRWKKYFKQTPQHPSLVYMRETIELFKKATAQEIKIVGSKYIGELYFPRVEIEQKFEQFLSSNATCFLIVAKAGRGKTNLLCQIIEKMQEEHPILFLSGRMEPGDSNGILKRISSRLGYGENWQTCFEDLGRFAESITKPLILIDGINESAAKPQVMQDALHELLVQASLNNIKVCITCRTDFWKFYRSSYWREFVWSSNEQTLKGATVRGEDLPIFSIEDFEQIVERYFQHFTIRGTLTGEAWERCRNPLLLRFFCEAYSNRNVGVVTQIRLYSLFKLFWSRKIENIQEVVGMAGTYPINRLILLVAQLMRQHHQTRIPKESIAERANEDITRTDSLYMRILDEEILLEEELDELNGTTNIIFVYDRFSEYAIALHIFSDSGWLKKTEAGIISDVKLLMDEEIQYGFATLRGALEFLVQRLEEYRGAEGIHYRVIRTMLEQDWKWRRIGTMLAFQLASISEDAFWDFLKSLITDKREFVRHICAEQLVQLVGHNIDRVLPLFNTLLQDNNASVRHATKLSLLHLEASLAIQEAQVLIKEQPLGEDSDSLAAELLLSPIDSRSSLLKKKLRWLVKENHDDAIRNAVTAFLTNLYLPAYEDLTLLEELERAVHIVCEDESVDKTSYLVDIQSNILSRKKTLNTLLERIQVVYRIMRFIYEFTVDFLKKEGAAAQQIFFATLESLFPSVDQREEFIQIVEQEATPFLKEVFQNEGHRSKLLEKPLRVVDIALELAASTPEFTQPSLKCNYEPQEKVLWAIDINTRYSLFYLYEVINDVFNELAQIVSRKQTPADLDFDLMQEGLSLISHEAWLDLINKVASKKKVEISPREQSSLSSLGRLILWIWNIEPTRYATRYHQANSEAESGIRGRRGYDVAY